MSACLFAELCPRTALVPSTIAEQLNANISEVRINMGSKPVIDIYMCV
jgi:hypothetical protein